MQLELRCQCCGRMYIVDRGELELDPVEIVCLSCHEAEQAPDADGGMVGE